MLHVSCHCTSQMHVPFVCLGNQPKPLMTQHPVAQKLYAGELVSLKCEVKLGSDWEYFWYKDGPEVSTGNMLNIPSASNMDNGSYECKAVRSKTKYQSQLSEKRDIHISGESKECALLIKSCTEK